MSSNTHQKTFTSVLPSLSNMLIKDKFISSPQRSEDVSSSPTVFTTHVGTYNPTQIPIDTTTYLGRRQSKILNSQPFRRHSISDLEVSKPSINVLDLPDNINQEILDRYGNDLFTEIYDIVGTDVIFHKKIGDKSVFGSVFIVRIIGKLTIFKIELVNDEKFCRISPSQSIYKYTRFEFDMHQLFYEKGMNVVRPLFHLFFQNGQDVYSATCMEFDPRATEIGTLKTFLRIHQPQEVLDNVLYGIYITLQSMCSNNLIHGDFHTSNIMFQISDDRNEDTILKFPLYDDGKEVYLSILLIDFGFSGEGRCLPELEILQLIRTIYSLKHNRDYLVNGFLEMLKIFKCYELLELLPETFTWTEKEIDYIDKIYEQLLRRYCDVLIPQIEKVEL